MLVLKITFFFTCISFRKIVEANPIRGGDEVSAVDSYPYMASLRYKYYQPPEHYCGGAIIDRRFILTAAHCIEGKRPKDFVIVSVGSIETELVTNRYDIEVAVTHGEHPKRGFDIGLIRVTRDIRFSENVKLIPLDTQNILQAGDILTVMGFGYTGLYCQEDPRFLQKLDMKLEGADGNHIVLHTIRDDEEAARDIKGICAGDSGSPIVRIDSNGEPILVGIVVEAEGPYMYGINVHKNLLWIYDESFNYMTPEEKGESELTPNLLQ